jgi:hypothetical protein
MQIVESILHNYQYNTTTINMTKSDKVVKNKEKGKEEDKNMETRTKKNGLLLRTVRKKYIQH